LVILEDFEITSTLSRSTSVHSITPDGPVFPDCLKSISFPPAILYYRGDITLLNNSNKIAIVGTRTPTDSGIDECRYITKWFVERGYCVVSGLARGIDAVTHDTCLTFGGKTIAVLPSGIGNIYPKENLNLSERILESGGLFISEYPEHSLFKKSYFVLRDRLQTGLSQGVIVIETELNGGTMHTAKFAIKQNRPLGCVEFSNESDMPVIRSGNQLLLSSGKAFGINRENLLVFKRMLRPLV
jgi:DNA processing protein